MTLIVWDDTPPTPPLVGAPAAAAVVAAFAALHGVTAADIRGRGRQAHIARARHAVWRELRRLGWSYPAIGAAFQRDHSTVMQVLRGRRGT